MLQEYSLQIEHVKEKRITSAWMLYPETVFKVQFVYL